MATKNIRSEYVKSLLEDKEALNKQLESVTETTIKSIIEDKVKDNFRQIISEDADTFEEEEVEEEPTDTEEDTEGEDKSDDINADVVDNEDGDDDADDELGMGDDTADKDGGEDDTEVWDALEDYKGEDGEYDLTGMDANKVLKVLKVMKPEDGVRVVKNDEGDYELSDDETGKEYIIQVDTDDNTEDEDDIEADELGESKEYCIEFDVHGNTGYTTNYQKQTAMTTPDNYEPSDSSKTYSMDGGVPTGTEKPFPGNGNKSPYDNNVNEEACEDEEMNEAMTTQEDGAYNRGDGMAHTNTNSKAAKGRNSHAGGVQVHGTGENSYSEAQMESIKRKANEIFKENKQLKSILPTFKKQLQEAIVINQSLGYIVRLLKENATSSDEKQNIIKKFSDIKTLKEGTAMFKAINEELHRNHQSQNVENVFNTQLFEASKHTASETPMYQSDDLSKSLDLMRRLNQIK